jgi:hypothetical protein
VFPATLGDYFGCRKYVTSSYVFLYTARVLLAIIGGYPGALIFEQFGSWTPFSMAAHSWPFYRA